MLKMKSFSKRLLKNNKGQGMVEYILILVVVVAIVTAAKKPIMEQVTQITDKLGVNIGNVLNSN